MPLIVAYRPVVLPEELRAPRRPAPYSARLKREAPSLRAVLRRRERRRLRLAALAALPAAALTLLSWNGAMVEPATAHATAPGLQPFEAPGENFPGSAFYYLAPDSGVLAPPGRPAATADEPAPRPLDAAFGDAAARPTFLAGTAQDRLRALQCLTAAIYYEAATEPEAGQRAVAQVVLNRVAHPAWPNSVCGVVYQGSERPGCQFSFACDGSMARAPARSWWLRARAVAEQALAGEVYAPVGLATFYHTFAVHPGWADAVAYVGSIGAHRFYRLPGPAGRGPAFRDSYLGGEPLAAPHPRAAGAAPATPSDPAALAAAFASARGEAQRQAGWSAAGVASPVPTATAVAADPLPPAGAIRPEWQHSGRWIVQPKG